MRTNLENVLSAIVTEGWANDSFGDVNEYGAHYALVTITDSEFLEVADAMADVLSVYPVDLQDLVGNFIMVTDTMGNVDLTRYAGYDDAVHAFNAGRDNYAAWYLALDA